MFYTCLTDGKIRQLRWTIKWASCDIKDIKEGSMSV